MMGKIIDKIKGLGKVFWIVFAIVVVNLAILAFSFITLSNNNSFDKYNERIDEVMGQSENFDMNEISYLIEIDTDGEDLTRKEADYVEFINKAYTNSIVLFVNFDKMFWEYNEGLVEMDSGWVADADFEFYRVSLILDIIDDIDYDDVPSRFKKLHRNMVGSLEDIYEGGSNFAKLATYDDYDYDSMEHYYKVMVDGINGTLAVAENFNKITGD